MRSNGTSKRVLKGHIERFPQEAESYGSLEKMLEAYEKEKESAKMAPPATFIADVPVAPPTFGGGVVDKVMDKPVSNVEEIRSKREVPLELVSHDECGLSTRHGSWKFPVCSAVQWIA